MIEKNLCSWIRLHMFCLVLMQRVKCKMCSGQFPLQPCCHSDVKSWQKVDRGFSSSCYSKGKTQSYDAKRQTSVGGSFRIPSYDVHYLKESAPYDNPAYEQDLKKRYTTNSTLPQKTTTVITTMQSEFPDNVTLQKMWNKKLWENTLIFTARMISDTLRNDLIKCKFG